MDDKKFVMPEAEIVSYSDEDIITLSNYGLAGWDDGVCQESGCWHQGSYGMQTCRSCCIRHGGEPCSCSPYSAGFGKRYAFQ